MSPDLKTTCLDDENNRTDQSCQRTQKKSSELPPSSGLAARLDEVSGSGICLEIIHTASDLSSASSAKRTEGGGF